MCSVCHVENFWVAKSAYTANVLVHFHTSVYWSMIYDLKLLHISQNCVANWSQLSSILHRDTGWPTLLMWCVYHLIIKLSPVMWLWTFTDLPCEGGSSLTKVVRKRPWEIQKKHRRFISLQWSKKIHHYLWSPGHLANTWKMWCLSIQTILRRVTHKKKPILTEYTLGRLRTSILRQTSFIS